MSLKHPTTMSCPLCGAHNDALVFASINGAVRPDLRDAVLADTLMTVTCASCEQTTRAEPELTYFDLDLGLWVRALDVERLSEWRPAELEAQLLWFSTFGPMAAPIAQSLGEKVRARVTFGWAGLREKLLCAQHGLDDVSLELAKLAAFLNGGGQQLDDGTEWRLSSVEDDILVLDVTCGGIELSVDQLLLPRQALAEIEAEPEVWARSRELIEGAGFYVDLNRALVESIEKAA